MQSGCQKPYTSTGWLEAEKVTAAFEALHQACMSCKKIQKEMEEIMESVHSKFKQNIDMGEVAECADNGNRTDDAMFLMASVLDALEQEDDIMVCTSPWFQRTEHIIIPSDLNENYCEAHAVASCWY